MGCLQFFPENGIELLSLMSLIKIDKDDKIMMHDQLRDLGREIVRLEHTKEPQERSRLWIHEEALDVIDNNKGSSKIEALCLGLSEFEALFLGDYYYKKSYRGEQFNELTNLRFLQLGNVNLIRDFQNLLPQLRWLQWKGCPLDFNMVNFHPKKLAVLDLSRSYISEDWGGWDPLKMATKLKVLNLSYCENLRRIPNLSTLKSLEILNLENCRNLEEIHPSIWYIKTLVSLDVHGCFKLEKLPTRVGRMEELRELLYYDKLAQLPESMGSFKWLTKLDLSQTRIKELPEFIGSMKALETLNVSWCGLLDRIPNSIGNLASLSLLNLLGCQLLREIPNSIGKLTSLIKLQLTKTSITKLPESIGNLKNLRILELDETPMTNRIA
ncbi:disease resistance protein RPV1-like [Eucalyptus grandis]|uniref:disease resistance protein RPV1-like n=1 Tax=Eucalyptus grandis TaxID=71139 RepID=UPI00192EC09F|nr:disease resistance protein RPV1-like [Eucalyptus grandis]